MKVFRLRYIIETFSLFTGIIFLNMSFVLAEVSALRMDQDKQMLQNLSALIAGCAAEEEPGNAADEDSTLSEIDLIFPSYGNSSKNFEAFSKNKSGAATDGVPRLGNYEIYSPPPEG